MSRPVALLLCSVLGLSACSATDPADPAGAGEPGATASARGAESDAATAELSPPESGTVLLPSPDATALAVAASSTLFDTAPVVVLAGADDVAAQARAASAAVHLGAPLLLAGAASAGASPEASPEASPVAAEIARLESEAVLSVGTAATAYAEQLDDVDVVVAPSDAAEFAELTGMGAGDEVVVQPAHLTGTVSALSADAGVPVLAVPPASRAGPATEGEGELPDVEPAEPLDDVVALTPVDTHQPLAAIATARAAGVEVLATAASDPRADPAVVAALGHRQPDTVLALGDGFGAPERLADRVATAITGVQLPGGGQLVLPGKRYVALYGHPGTSALGVLGEQGPDASVARVQRLAAEYRAAGSAEPVVPTFEIITTIASAARGADGDYSDESSIEQLKPYVDAAARAGVYVVLDLQPGYTDFLTQAKRYEELLALPHVGLALDPEWRLRPGERHMRQIGRVSAAEVNSVIDWLATFTRDRRLPQKMLLLHQFKSYMLENREQIDTSRDELAVITQMDGHGPPSVKMDTWNAIRPGAPAGMTFGWKNFYDEDKPMLTPAQTLAVTPTPVFVSYQ
jgi:hypothetical protein